MNAIASFLLSAQVLVSVERYLIVYIFYAVGSAHTSASGALDVTFAQQRHRVTKLLSTGALDAAALLGAKMAGRGSKRKFIDSLRMLVKGGSGGMGYPRYGGIGGKGGDVYVEAQEISVGLVGVSTAYPTRRVAGTTGGNSKAHRLMGELGKDHIIKCPTGVTVISDQQQVLGNLDKDGDRILVARGGQGGCPQNRFFGQSGQAHSVTLDLKLIADVGLVGFPNAGKSSLLRVLSRAAPKIASYPFTTVCPQLGAITYKDLRQISVADLPGLIEGAHTNVGLGHKFLKHVERTKMLLFVIDIHGFQLEPWTRFRSALETIVLLNKELELYSEGILDKPAILAVNKMDLKGSTERLRNLVQEIQHIEHVTRSWPSEYLPKRFIQFDDIIPIAAKTGQMVDDVKQRLRELIDHYDDVKRGAHHQQVQNLDLLLGKRSHVKLL